MTEHRPRGGSNEAAEPGTRHPDFTFRILSGLIVAAITATFVVGFAARHRDPVLPIQFRLLQPHLSKLPVHIDHIYSCSCWHGPRDQAQRKYKFRVINNTDEVIDIDGGAHSVIRLIVAYPNHHAPQLTLPASSDDAVLAHLGSPPDVPISVTDRTAPVHPSEIHGANSFFGVPTSYSVWALPATPNKLAEQIEAHDASFPTVVDHPHLIPGEGYEGHRLGHGTWTFYIPLPHRFAASFKADATMPMLLPREVYERQVIFVGIAALAPGTQDGVHLLGFAPAPSDDALMDPGDL